MEISKFNEQDVVFLGPPAEGRRYVSGLAVRSALRRQSRLGLAFGHPCTSLGRLAFGHI
ncbi:hypothetical protein SGRA_2032 [Saprospira grandis str. Lewin]|uniref:Uncharacterized protein n=1 Tax=Saprospira grandis (strain Lewin) TaxID=984262 RepID=H6L2C5_SAPGL|nr:hypothetical protein SGRA_2032 [Saprospira grandis str. Lewin]